MKCFDRKIKKMKETITKKEKCLKNHLEDTYWKDRGIKQRNGKEKVDAKITVSNRKEKNANNAHFIRVTQSLTKIKVKIKIKINIGETEAII